MPSAYCKSPPTIKWDHWSAAYWAEPWSTVLKRTRSVNAPMISEHFRFWFYCFCEFSISNSVSKSFSFRVYFIYTSLNNSIVQLLVLLSCRISLVCSVSRHGCWTTRYSTAGHLAAGGTQQCRERVDWGWFVERAPEFVAVCILMHIFEPGSYEMRTCEYDNV